MPGSEQRTGRGQLDADRREGDPAGGSPPRLTFRLSDTDFLRANRFHRNRYERGWIWSLLVLFLLALLGAAVLVYALTRKPEVNPIAIALPAVAMLWILYRILALAFWPYLNIPTRRRVSRELDRLGESTVDLDDDGLRLVTANRSNAVRWDGLRGHAESEHAFLLYFTASQFAIIPKAALTPALCDRIRALISRKLRPR